MKITNSIDPLRSRKTSFGARLPKASRDIIKGHVQDFIGETIQRKNLRNSQRIIYPVMAIVELSVPVVSAVEHKITSGTVFCTMLSYYFARNAEILHKQSIEGSKNLASRLKSKGFSEAERLFGVKKYISRTDCPLISDIYKLTHKKTLQKIANGVDIDKR